MESEPHSTGDAASPWGHAWTTEELARRPLHGPADHLAESRVLAELALALAEEPGTAFRKLTDAALHLCGAETAGVGVVETGDAPAIRWLSVSGHHAPHLGRTVPLAASPSAAALERGDILLVPRPGARFPEWSALDPPAEEVLYTPFHADGKPAGTLWVAAHGPERIFDAEDARILRTLSRFAAAAHRLAAPRTPDGGDDERQETRAALRQVSGYLADQMRVFDTAVSSVRDFVYLFDRDGRFTFANPALMALWGLTLAEVVGKDFHALKYPPELAERLRRQIAEVVATGQPLRDEATYAAPGGEAREYEYILAPVIDPSGEVSAVAGSTRDVTDRKRAEEAVRASEAQFRLLVENVPDYAIFRLCVLGRVVSWNDGAARLLGYAAEEVMDGPVDRFFTPEDQARGLSARELRAAELAGRSSDDNWLVRKDGSRFWASGASNAVRDDRGKLLGFVKIFRDLTERRAAEAAVRESREQLRLGLAAARMGIWTLDMGSATHTRDGNLNRLLGLPPVETTQSFADFLAIIHPDDRAAVTADFAASAEQGRTLNTEFRVVRPDGTVRWLRDQGDVFGEPGAKAHLMAGACVDITERKEAEAELVRARDRLEERVRERTAEIAAVNAALEAEVGERKLAQQARQELIGRIVTTQEEERRRIARELHDSLGQYLAAMSLGLRAAQDGIDACPGAAERLELLSDLTREMGQEVHRIAVELRPTSLDDLGLPATLRQYVETWSARTGIAAEFATLGLAGERYPWQVSTAVYRIVQEALTNVVRHSGAGRVDVVLERRADHLVAIVEDDGRGFAADRPAAGGGGLGLLGMRERVALVGGSFQIESTPGEGTTLFVRVPLPLPLPGADHG